METGSLIEVARSAITTVLLVSAPPLIVGLVVGLIISIFQSITSIQEQTLAFVPKILAVFAALLIFGTFMFSTLEDFSINLIKSIPEFISHSY